MFNVQRESEPDRSWFLYHGVAESKDEWFLDLLPGVAGQKALA
jgi:hypothetical protein